MTHEDIKQLIIVARREFLVQQPTQAEMFEYMSLIVQVLSEDMKILHPNEDRPKIIKRIPHIRLVTDDKD